MRFTPHNYQRFAIERIKTQEAVGLLLDMGLGKTVITLTAASDLLEDGEVSKVLVIAPLRVAEDTWSREASKWDHLSHLRVSKVLGSEAKRLKALGEPADVYVINRENVEWLVKFYGKRWNFDMVVVDELSSFKSSGARRFRALRQVRPLMKRIVGLTGTPAPNGLIDLWAQVYLLDSGERLGRTVGAYRERYFTAGRRNGAIIYDWRPKQGAAEAIYKKLEGLCVSMSARDWLELPERVDRVTTVRLPELAVKQYRQLERDLLLPMVGQDVVASNAATLSNKLLQMANGAIYDEARAVRYIHSAKLDALESLIESANGRPVLVFYYFKHDADALVRRFGAKVLTTSEDVAAWNSGDVPLMLAHPMSAGHGLNLQDGGSTIVWYGLTWSLELYQQANARLHRQGQTERVVVHHLVAEGTIDEDVMLALSGKCAGQDALLSAVRVRLSKVSGG